ncbi:MAG TPA: hypothetical protein DEF51_20900, partial [Myxococcales bacterium]|nr:hypothetical protein [Myxococcales bacterium]
MRRALSLILLVAASPAAAQELGVSATVEREEHDGRAQTTVTREDLEERLPRSAPDALRDVPGV